MMNTIAEEILERAGTYLTSGWSSGKPAARMASRASSELIYDHSLRVLELAKVLMRDPAISEKKVDLQVLSVCCLFHDAGWVDMVMTGKVQPAEVYVKASDAALFKRSAQIACEQVGKLLSERNLEKIVQALSEIRSSSPELSETLLTADADNLESFGLTGLTFQIRAAQAAGKSVKQILESWHRQQEYHYWESRIKNTFYLETSKKIARHRLDAMGNFFDLLQRETALEDIDWKALKESPHFISS